MNRLFAAVIVWITVLGTQVSAQPAPPPPAPPPPVAPAVVPPTPPPASPPPVTDGSAATAANADQLLKLEGSDIPDFDKIRTPDSPAFTLLGVSPTQIERPTTPKELTAVLSKFVSEGDVVIPKNLAVEVAPFALLTKDADVDTYLNRSFGTQLWQNLSVSLATATSTRSDTDAMGMAITHTDSNLGIGIRTMSTLSGEQHAGCTTDELVALVDVSKAEAVMASPAGLKLARDTAAKMAAATTEDERAAIKADFDAKSLELKNLALKDADRIASLCIKEVASAHRGWIMDGAVASGFGFPDSAAKEGKYTLGSAWVDLAYEADNASVVMLARGRDDKTSGQHDYLGDFGARGIIAKDAYAASAELIWRHAFSKADSSTAADNTYRVALALDIHLTDATWLTLAFGHDFDASDAGSLFSLANLKYGVGNPKVKVKR